MALGYHSATGTESDHSASFGKATCIPRSINMARGRERRCERYDDRASSLAIAHALSSPSNVVPEERFPGEQVNFVWQLTVWMALQIEIVGTDISSTTRLFTEKLVTSMRYASNRSDARTLLLASYLHPTCLTIGSCAPLSEWSACSVLANSIR